MQRLEVSLIDLFSYSCAIMISIANPVPVLLFVLTLNNGGVYLAGIIIDTLVGMDMDWFHCKSDDFINTEKDRCYHWQGLPTIKHPLDPEFLSSLNNFVTSIEEDMTQFLMRMKEAHHCLYNSCSDCYDEFLADPANSVDNDYRRFVQDLELYDTDPDMLVDAIRVFCEIEEEGWSCFDDEKETGLLLCWMGEVQAMDSKLQKDLINKRSPIKTFKPALCEMYSGLQRCTTDHLQGCPQKTVSMAARAVNFLTPLGCHIHGTTGMKRDGERQAESAHIHDDL